MFDYVESFPLPDGKFLVITMANCSISAQTIVESHHLFVAKDITIDRGGPIKMEIKDES